MPFSIVGMIFPMKRWRGEKCNLRTSRYSISKISATLRGRTVREYSDYSAGGGRKQSWTLWFSLSHHESSSPIQEVRESRDMRGNIPVWGRTIHVLAA